MSAEVAELTEYNNLLHAECERLKEVGKLREERLTRLTSIVQEVEEGAGFPGVEQALAEAERAAEEAVIARGVAEGERDGAVGDVERARALMAQDVVELEKEVLRTMTEKDAEVVEALDLVDRLEEELAAVRSQTASLPPNYFAMRALAASHQSVARDLQASSNSSQHSSQSQNPSHDGSKNPPREEEGEHFEGRSEEEGNNEGGGPVIREVPSAGSGVSGGGGRGGAGGEEEQAEERELGDPATWEKLKASLTPWQRVQVETRLVRQALSSERKRRRMAKQFGLGDSLNSLSLREMNHHTLSESMQSITELGFSCTSLSDTKNSITELTASNVSNQGALNQLGLSASLQTLSHISTANSRKSASEELIDPDMRDLEATIGDIEGLEELPEDSYLTEATIGDVEGLGEEEVDEGISPYSTGEGSGTGEMATDLTLTNSAGGSSSREHLLVSQIQGLEQQLAAVRHENTLSQQQAEVAASLGQQHAAMKRENTRLKEELAALHTEIGTLRNSLIEEVEAASAPGAEGLPASWMGKARPELLVAVAEMQLEANQLGEDLGYYRKKTAESEAANAALRQERERLVAQCKDAFACKARAEGGTQRSEARRKSVEPAGVRPAAPAAGAARVPKATMPEDRVTEATGYVGFVTSLGLDGLNDMELMEKTFLNARDPAAVLSFLRQGLTLPRTCMRALLNAVRPQMAPGTGVASLTYSTEEETGLTRKLKTMKTGVEEVAEIATSMPRYSTPLQVACCLRVLGNYKGTLECLTPQDEVAVERTLFGFLQGALGQLEKPAKTETETPPALPCPTVALNALLPVALVPPVPTAAPAEVAVSPVSTPVPSPSRERKDSRSSSRSREDSITRRKRAPLSP